MSRDTAEVIAAVLYFLSAIICLAAMLLWKHRERYQFAGKAALLITGGRGIYFLALLATTSSMDDAQRRQEFGRPVHLIVASVYVMVISCYCLWIIARQNSAPTGMEANWYGRYVPIDDKTNTISEEE